MKRSWLPRLAVAAGALVFFSAGVAMADMTLRQREFAKGQDDYFKREIDSANDRCSTKFAAKIDWNSFKGEIDKHLDGKHASSYSFYGFCAEPLGTMAGMCGDSEDSKSSVKKRIKSYTCKFGGKGKRKIELKGSSLTMWVDWEAANYGDYIKGYLGKVL